MATQDLDSALKRLTIDKSRRNTAKSGGGGPWKWLFLIAILSSGGWKGIQYWEKKNAPLIVKMAKPEVQDSAQLAAQGPQGRETLVSNGYIIARNQIEVSSKIVGKVAEIYVDRGSEVKLGDRLLKIDDEEYQAQVQQQQARVEMLKSRVSELRAGSRPQEIDASKAALDSAEATQRRMKLDLDRLAKLSEEKVISPRELDTARQSYEVSEAQVNSARKNLELLKIGPRREVIQQAEAQLREAEAQLEFARTQLSYTVITAPMSGTILEKVAKLGELVTNMNFGGTRGAKSSAFSMADLKDLQVESDVNQNDIAKVKIGQKCRIKLDSHKDREFEGIVDEIAPQADRQKGTVQVKVRMTNPDNTVRPEVSARVTYLEDEAPVQTAKPGAKGESQRLIWVPKSAITEQSGAKGIFIDAAGKAFFRKLTLGADRDTKVQVTDGLIGTENLILEPSLVTEGVKVKSADAAATAK